MAYRVELSAEADRDLEVIFDFLYAAALEFGEGPEEALNRATRRLETIESAIDALARAPHQGTLRLDLLPGIRNVTKDRAVLYFKVDDAAEVVRVVAAFFGGQDHLGAMLLRVMGGRGAS